MPFPPDHQHPTPPPIPTLSPAISTAHNLLPAQTTHRIAILQHSGITNGNNLLEIGCGQGDCTTVLALLYPNSHIDAIDPGALDYGAPETLGQAHKRIKSYDFGNRVSFHQATPVQFLQGGDSDGKKEKGTDVEKREYAYDIAILCHCLWYFPSKDDVLATFKAARRSAKHLFIAEWGLRSNTPQGQTHVLAALARAACESRIPHSTENIRLPLAPATIKELAGKAGWTLEEEAWIVPGEELEDAR
ncbi:S-adenosyl-L-methionine-dependent methyltransferase [Byssothecium circinans]|uniref:S-adenosyl-L-methionine-dependent methyltransferase n=1 Tax=Byssothecium circinans TaxID=147558 RepID=A0A6A5U6V4_9PLEO|nr:S-adenosyl-L-methionine-dependent methyltransferase [Byssothecium circinans]